MVASEESQNSCHFSMSPLNFLNSRLGNRILVFNFGMSTFPASLLSFSSSIYFTFSSIFILFTLVWASNSIFAFSRFSLSSSILSWLRNLSFLIPPLISICFSLFLCSISNCFSFPLCFNCFSFYS